MHITPRTIFKDNSSYFANKCIFTYDMFFFKNQGLFIHFFSVSLIAVIPLGLMHDAHYSQNVPKYLNVGSLGLTLAHEILHTLDQMGRGFDANGTKRVSSSNKSSYD